MNFLVHLIQLLLCTHPLQILCMQSTQRNYLTKLLVNKSPNIVQVNYQEPDNGFAGRDKFRTAKQSWPPKSNLTI